MDPVESEQSSHHHRGSIWSQPRFGSRRCHVSSVHMGHPSHQAWGSAASMSTSPPCGTFRHTCRLQQASEALRKREGAQHLCAALLFTQHSSAVRPCPPLRHIAGYICSRNCSRCSHVNMSSVQKDKLLQINKPCFARELHLQRSSSPLRRWLGLCTLPRLPGFGTSSCLWAASRLSKGTE